jgi:hypothetical protein
MATPYMNLSLPVPGSTAGPAYASMLVAALTTIDAHDHSPGKGVPVRTSGLYVDADLAFGTKNLSALRSARFTSQDAALALPTDLNCLAVVGGELYYNDGVGNAIQLTSGGALNAASLGAIGGDYATSPGASLFYASGSALFSMESAAGVKAYAAHGPLYLYEPVAGGKYARVKVPTGLAANYDLTLPAALPAATKILTLDNTGAVAATYDVDGTSLEVASNTIGVKDLGITTAKIADLNVTRPKLAAVGQQASASSGSFATSAGAFVDVTNLTVTITTTGRPVYVALQSAAGVGSSVIGATSVSGTGPYASFRILRDATTIAWHDVKADDSGTSGNIFVPASIVAIDAPGAGTYTYKVQAMNVSDSAHVEYAKLVAYEL